MMWQWPSGWCTSMASLSSQAQAAVSSWSCFVAEIAACKFFRALLAGDRDLWDFGMYVCTL